MNGVSYGYNGYGLRSTGHVYSDTTPTLGLGGSVPAMSQSVITPVKPVEVVSPANMIAIGDSMRMPVLQSETYSYLIALGDKQRPSPDRHNGGSNLTFADGHVENLRNEELVADTDAARSRWNNDDRPHFEISLEGY